MQDDLDVKGCSIEKIYEIETKEFKKRNQARIENFKI